MPWPSLTVEWFPDLEDQTKYNTQRLLLGTQTCGQGDEFLRIAKFNHDIENSKPDLTKFDANSGEIGGYSSNTHNKVEIVQRIRHHGEANKARIMPQNPELIASFSSTGTVYIVDRTKHSSDPTSDYSTGDIILPHHEQEGFGLSWNKFKKGHLVTGSNDCSIALWDITRYSTDRRTMNPTNVIKPHMSLVNDVEWHPFNQDIFGSVSEDKSFNIHDTRQLDNPTSTKSIDCAMNAISFNLTNQNLLATGSERGIDLWDIRNFSSPLPTLHKNFNSTNTISALRWSPHHPTILSSASSNLVHIWDAANIANENEPLLFVHGGHISDVSDLSWNPYIPWMMSSVSTDNALHIWKIAGTIVN